MLHDLRFHLQLYRAAKETGWVHAPTFGPGLLRGRGLETCGLDEPLAGHVGQETLSEFLVEQTSLWHREEQRRERTRTCARDLPAARGVPLQRRGPARRRRSSRIGKAQKGHSE